MMIFAGDFLNGSNGNCECCELPNDAEEKAYGCAGRMSIFTLRERMVLEEIRKVGEQARLMRQEIRRLERDEPLNVDARRKAAEKLAELREQRLKLEEERLSAAHERMRILGHA